MEAKQLHNIWKVKGFWKEKVCFFLSCFLIYPIFGKKKHEKLIDQIVDSLTFLQEKLIKIVKFRQHSLAILYIKYHKQLPKIIEELSCQVIEQEVDKYNFNSLELEIEGIYQLVNNASNYNRQMALEYKHILAWSEEEFINVMLTYHSNHSLLKSSIYKFPWKFMVKVFNLEALEFIN